MSSKTYIECRRLNETQSLAKWKQGESDSAPLHFVNPSHTDDISDIAMTHISSYRQSPGKTYKHRTSVSIEALIETDSLS